jgi:excisionase family DNA binding protein
VNEKTEEPMTIIERLEQRRKAMTALELAEMLTVSRRHLYQLAAKFYIPSFRVGGALRFDPQSVAGWLKAKEPPQSKPTKNRRN